MGEVSVAYGQVHRGQDNFLTPTKIASKTFVIRETEQIPLMEKVCEVIDVSGDRPSGTDEFSIENVERIPANILQRALPK